jgi:hypothetical protein
LQLLKLAVGFTDLHKASILVQCLHIELEVLNLHFHDRPQLSCAPLFSEQRAGPSWALRTRVRSAPGASVCTVAPGNAPKFQDLPNAVYTTPKMPNGRCESADGEFWTNA